MLVVRKGNAESYFTDNERMLAEEMAKLWGTVVVVWTIKVDRRRKNGERVECGVLPFTPVRRTRRKAA